MINASIVPLRYNSSAPRELIKAMAKGPDGAYYVSELIGFPFTKGASRIWRIDC